jgi:SOS-response transcriptional repressor LexA
MQDVSIVDGDLAVVETNAPTSPGDIVAALVDGDRTVKHLRRDRRGFYLQAANAAKAYPEIRPKSSLEILGVVISVVRRIRR